MICKSLRGPYELLRIHHKNIIYDIYRKFNSRKQNIVYKNNRKIQKNYGLNKLIYTETIISEQLFDNLNLINAVKRYQSNYSTELKNQLTVIPNPHIDRLWMTENNIGVKEALSTH
jgi:hypothetical protein